MGLAMGLLKVPTCRVEGIMIIDLDKILPVLTHLMG